MNKYSHFFKHHRCCWRVSPTHHSLHLYHPHPRSYHYLHHHRLQTEPTRHQPSSAQGFTQAAVHALIKQNPFSSSSSSSSAGQSRPSRRDRGARIQFKQVHLRSYFMYWQEVIEAGIQNKYMAIKSCKASGTVDHAQPTFHIHISHNLFNQYISIVDRQKDRQTDIFLEVKRV